MSPTRFDARAQSHRYSGQCARVWLQRIDRIYREIRRQPPPSISRARKILWNRDARTSHRERLLIALVDHPDRDAAASLLCDPTLPMDTARLRFARAIARRRQHSRRSDPALDAA